MERQKIKEEKDLPLHLKYRPKKLTQVLGQDHIVNSLKGLLGSKTMPHVYLFSGNSGTGKTTLARIIANYLECSDINILEIDAATYTGIDDMKQICEGLKYGAIGSNPIKFVIIDEAHSLSRKAWDSMLKIIESPPQHVFFCFCTTELGKVPDAIQTRCHAYNLRDVKIDDLQDLIDFVCEEEKIILPKDASYLIAKESYGSPRRALVYLSKCRSCKDKQEIIAILESAEESTDVIELCKLLISNKCTWTEVVKILRNLKEQNQESIRITICNYLNACILRARSEKEAAYFLSILDSFSRPIYQATGMTDILLSVGEICFRD